MPNFFRGRRLRRSQVIRNLVRETVVRPETLIQPYFVVDSEDEDFVQEIKAMPGQSQYGLKALERRVSRAADLGLRGLILFGIPAQKDERAVGAYAADGIVQRAVAMIKEKWPDLLVVTDVCLCEYTSHGHCGVVKNGAVINDASLTLLARTAVSHARAGADVVAPSDMMDGRVEAIRAALDEEGFLDLPIMSYAVKYSSSFYGPFREAAESTPQFGDRKTYQMDPANLREALQEAAADVAEGADLLLVKPGLPYLDVVRQVSERFDIPVGAYQVSGEYSMIRAAAANGWLDERAVVMETLTSLARAGARFVITYFAEQVLEWNRE
ncbi:MAG: porphobilinogen synthase [Deltaproteobacteria bacterium]|nr:porphobilinogen synthase [Deltaproteobacteria bacterium]